jgi:hypothetical protein
MACKTKKQGKPRPWEKTRCHFLSRTPSPVQTSSAHTDPLVFFNCQPLPHDKRFRYCSTDSVRPFLRCKGTPPRRPGKFATRLSERIPYFLRKGWRQFITDIGIIDSPYRVTGVLNRLKGTCRAIPRTPFMIHRMIKTFAIIRTIQISLAFLTYRVRPSAHNTSSVFKVHVTSTISRTCPTEKAGIMPIAPPFTRQSPLTSGAGRRLAH